MSGAFAPNPNYAPAFYKNRAIEHALNLYKNSTLSAVQLVEEAKIIEAYLNDTK